MAGCKPEYLPVVLAAVEAACTDEFNIHGLLATTMPVGPVLIVNGPIRRAIGMNAGINVFGQGNRANVTIGRALQLVIRNVGGGRPGEVDRATFGNPGKIAFCFAEDEEGSPWTPLSADFGVPRGREHGDALPGRGAALDRRPALARSRVARAQLRRLPAHGAPPEARRWSSTAILAVSPGARARVPRGGLGQGAARRDGSTSCCSCRAREIVRGAGGIAEGVPEQLADATLPKFRPGGLLDRPLRRRRGPLLVDHRRLGERRRSAASR